MLDPRKFDITRDSFTEFNSDNYYENKEEDYLPIHQIHLTTEYFEPDSIVNDNSTIEPKEYSECSNNDKTPPKKQKTSREKTLRKMVKLACINCRKSCKKCDNNRPCSRCIRYHLSSQCVDAPPRIKRSKAKVNNNPIQGNSMLYKENSMRLNESVYDIEVPRIHPSLPPTSTDSDSYYPNTPDNDFSVDVNYSTDPNHTENIIYNTNGIQSENGYSFESIKSNELYQHYLMGICGSNKAYYWVDYPSNQLEQNLDVSNSVSVSEIISEEFLI